MASETIRKFVTYLNNENKNGGYWLPNIQRQFVWKEEQIEKLYDSILREYPIGSLLVWRTEDPIKVRRFIDIYKDSLEITQYFVPENKKEKHLVLDGQQRLQSLFIGLKGSYNGKELFLDILSGDLVAPEDIKFNFKFLHPSNALFPFIKFKDLVFTDKKPRELKDEVTSRSNLQLQGDQINRIEDNLETIKHVFATQESLLYQIVDSVDRPQIYSQDDIVEIFIRANSGGTQLSKSDLLFSLLSASWDEADDNMVGLLNDLNATGYKFSRDFILKCCLVLANKGSKYKIEKFRDPTVRTKIIDNWNDLSEAIKDVKDFIYDKTFLRTDKTVPTYLSLVPIIYMRYHYKDSWDDYKRDYQSYLLRVSLSGAFGGTPDNLIDNLVKHIKENESFDLSDILGVIRENNRSLELTQSNILSLNYHKKEIHLFFNLWYGFNYQPTYSGNRPEIDHIFPQAELKKIKMVNPDSGKRNLMLYKWWDRDQLANLMLLTRTENGAGNKSDTLPELWFADKDDAYLDLHLIPRDPNLWKIENYDKFLAARKKLILSKFSFLISDLTSDEEE